MPELITEMQTIFDLFPMVPVAMGAIILAWGLHALGLAWRLKH